MRCEFISSENICGSYIRSAGPNAKIEIFIRKLYNVRLYKQRLHKKLHKILPISHSDSYFN